MSGINNYINFDSLQQTHGIEKIQFAEKNIGFLNKLLQIELNNDLEICIFLSNLGEFQMLFDFIYSKGQSKGFELLFELILTFRELINLNTKEIFTLVALDNPNEIQDYFKLKFDFFNIEKLEIENSKKEISKSIKADRKILFNLEKLFHQYEFEFKKHIGNTKKKPEGYFNKISELCWLFEAMRETDLLPKIGDKDIGIFVHNGCQSDVETVRQTMSRKNGDRNAKDRIDTAIKGLKLVIDKLELKKREL